VVPAGAGLLGQRPEPVQVDQLRIDDEPVTGRVRRDGGARRGGECLAHQGNALVDSAARVTGQAMRAPSPVEQLVDRDDVVGLDQQHRQQAPQLGEADRDRHAVDGCLDLAEQPEFHPHTGPPPKPTPPTRSTADMVIRPGSPAQPTAGRTVSRRGRANSRTSAGACSRAVALPACTLGEPGRLPSSGVCLIAGHGVFSGSTLTR
jgi:hypothetical protein